MTSYEFWTLVIAAVALALSVYNMAHDHLRDRVKLRVRFSNGSLLTPYGKRPAMQFTIVNLSSIPLFIDEVGFEARKGPGRWTAVPTDASGAFYSPWPAKLEPRQSLNLYLDASEAAKLSGDAGRCRVKTSCGAEFRGNKFQAAKNGNDRVVGGGRPPGVAKS